MKGILGKKVGMTSIFDQQGKQVACTVIEAGPCVVTQVKTVAIDGYNAIQLGFDPKKEKSTTKPMKGHFAKASTAPLRKVVEFRDCELDKKLGDTVTSEIFTEGEVVNVIGKTKGKGFQGVVKRHGFHGVGGRTHGQHDRNRAPGSLGGSSYPARVFKGMRMGGRMGGDRVKVQNLTVVKIFAEQNLIVVHGNVPGAKGSYLIIENAK